MLSADLQRHVADGWAVFPCHSVVDGRCTCGKANCDSPGKHPRPWNGVKAATNDIEQIHDWASSWPDANWAVATGDRSGVVVIDLDVSKGKDGFASFDALLVETATPQQPTLVVRTGGGGRHYYFRTLGQRFKNRVNLRSGVDIRADGGYVMLPGSSHISGATYVVEADYPIAALPDQLARELGSAPPQSREWSTPSQLTAGFAEGNRDDGLFLLACYLRRALKDDRDAVTLIVLEAAANCTPPFPERDALVKVESAFNQDHSDFIDLDRIPFAAPDGELYDFLRDLEPDMVEAIEKAVKAAKVRTFAARVLREERMAKYGDTASLDGDSFMFGDVAVDVPIWGDGDDLLWSEGGGVMIASDQGLGKSLTAQQVIAARIGVGPQSLLGLSVHPLVDDKLVVYLALDRPRQIARSMARLFTTDSERETAKDRLRIWTKPVPIDILGDPFAFADWLQDTFGSNIGDLVIDSVKDLTPANLSNGEVGQALDMAWKECRARGMSTMLLHHERKASGDESRSNRQPSLDHIYGSVWLTSGMDSVLHIQGKQGENYVRYTHLKSILNMLDPIDAIHDQENGRTDVFSTARTGNATASKVEQVFAFIAQHSNGGEVVTTADVVSGTGLSQPSVKRYVAELKKAGRIEEATPFDRGTGTPATYRAVK
ncbi:MAG TPA: bifunctional DNA primase/polymerase [Candidatus Lumbricidophila sp.]|nr:bifunctional DNA primase/polymerase [Candidatus Lumbricidophila sp.]